MTETNAKQYIFSEHVVARGRMAAPEGKVWVAREMFSYQTDIPKFTAHLQAMAEGLERAYYSEFHPDNYDDEAAHWVIGIRDITEADRTELDRLRIHREQMERAELERLKAKYEPSEGNGGSHGR